MTTSDLKTIYADIYDYIQFPNPDRGYNTNTKIIDLYCNFLNARKGGYQTVQDRIVKTFIPFYSAKTLTVEEYQYSSFKQLFQAINILSGNK